MTAKDLLRRLPLHPFLFGIFPVASLFSANRGQVFLSELLLPLVVVLPAVALLYAVLALAFRDVRRGAFATSLVTVLFFTYGHASAAMYRLQVERGIALRAWHTDFLWAILLVLGLVATFALPRASPLPTRVATIVAAGMLVLPVSSVAGYTVQAAEIPPPPAAAEGRLGELGYAPNVYFVLLDGYAHPSTLDEVFGYDDSAFVEGLERRGFYVVPESTSNYAQTYVSLPSMLNMEYLPPASLNDGPGTALQKIRYNEVASRFQGYGYRYVLFSSGWSVTGRDGIADWVVDCAGLTEFQRQLVLTTPLLNLPEFMVGEHRDRILCQFDLLEDMPETPGPFFVFAHIVAPHPPFVFDADGGEVDPGLAAWDGVIDSNDTAEVEEKRRLYAGQVAYVNREVEELVDNILAREERPPVIILLSDHGSDLQGRTHGVWADPTEAWYRERMRNFEAIYLPDDGEADLWPTMTPVNVFRFVFSRYFGEDLPPLEDRALYSDPAHPAAFKDVTEIVRFR